MKPGCVGYGGKPKRAYATLDAALTEAARHVGMSPYRCKEHGFHVGHDLSRGLRTALQHPTHTKPHRRKGSG